ncbi:glutathione S-transferase family protein [Vibrio coralliilyticus]|uniref:glutathione S-transferase family protein n=1 Tax=Vibrio coralliilyticus TaxID=190893 RepID=UPI002409FD8F|nr:glutathione S-transferase family protein [Vibrio coralliilyticus]WFB51056.1 glutathione S-transferase family protein [Vibrio coralliilyticus]
MLTLYWHPLSGHAHRAHLLLSFLDVEFTLVPVDLPAGEHRQPAFLALNPFGQIPVLVDGETVIADSNAILVYLASVYDTQQQWLPPCPIKRAHIEQFLSLAAHRLAGSLAKLRAANVFHRPIKDDSLRQDALTVLTQLEGYLADRQWLVGPTPTLADLALYTYTKLAPEAGMDLQDYPALTGWLARIEALPGFVPMTLSDVGLRQPKPPTLQQAKVDS